jgi:hypothetical protein
VSIAVGALTLVMIGRLTSARWLVVVRRPAEAIAAVMPLFALLVLPLLLGRSALYPWAQPLAALAPHVRMAVEKKEAWLSTPLFVVRTVLYLVCWIVPSELLWRWSIADDRRAPGEPSAGNAAALSALGLIVVGFTFSFACFDWLMSLEPDWSSTVYGIYVFSGGFLAALALLAVLARGLERSGRLVGVVAADHAHALGRLLLTMVSFWAYIAFAQAFVVWIADLPREAQWYLVRWERGWAGVVAALVVGQFVLPFVLLLSRPLKRSSRALAAVGALLLAMHWLDLYWLVVPSTPGVGAWPGWPQLAALLAVLGAAVAFVAWRWSGHSAVAVGDPGLGASLTYVSR